MVLPVTPAKTGFTAAETSNLQHTFIDTSIPATGNTLVSWKWEFGDGTLAFVQNPPPHQYQSPGDYPIRLTVIDDAGNARSAIQMLRVIDTSLVGDLAPYANWQASIDGLDVIFSDASYLGTGALAAIRFNANNWSFGDAAATTASGTSVPNLYNAAGRFTVGYTVVDNNGNTFTATMPTCFTEIDLAAGEFASNVDWADSLNALKVTFANSTPATSPEGNAWASWYWDFGNGTTSALRVPAAVTYAAAGKYIVQVVAVDTAGNAYNLDKTIQVKATTPIYNLLYAQTANNYGTLELVFLSPTQSVVSGDLAPSSTQGECSPAPGAFVVSIF